MLSASVRNPNETDNLHQPQALSSGFPNRPQDVILNGITSREAIWRRPRLIRSGLTAPKPDRVFHWAFAASIAVALAVISPFCFLGQASGHDFQFHVASWVDVAQQWRAGVIFPRWAVWANHGFGEPRFIFYPPLSWCLGAGLGLVLPWSLVPATFIVLCLALSGVSMFRLARAWLSPAAALAAAVLYAANPYQLVLAYVRSDFAELLAASFFPLAIHYALRCSALDKEGRAKLHLGALRDVALLALVYSAIWLANAPAAVVASYALAFLLVLCAVLRRSLRPLLVGLPALALGLLLAAFYIVPAACERGWVDIGQINSPGFLPAENFLFTWILDPEHNVVNLEISTVAVLIIVLTGIAAVLSHRRAKGSRFAWNTVLSLAALSLFFMFPVSSVVWRAAPELKFLQFPWRWLLVLSVSFAFFVGEAVATSRHRVSVALACAAVLIGTGVFLTQITYWDSDDLSDLVTAVSMGQGYDGVYEYCPFACDPATLPPNSPLVALLPGETRENPAAGKPRPAKNPGAVSIKEWQPEHKTFTVDAPVPVRAALRLLSYPAWAIQVNGMRSEAAADPETEQIIVPVPAGESRVEIRLARTADRTIGGALTGIAVLAIGSLLCLGYRSPERTPG